jgi:rubrerythrin
MQDHVDFERLTLRDALDLAILIEDEARERYEGFSRVVGGRYAGDASDMFRAMAGYEARHGEELAERRRKLFGDEPAQLDRGSIDDVEAPDRSAPRTFMSARQAMEVAYASEEKAADFFSQALRHVTDPEVRALFQELHGEELRHQQWVKERLVILPQGPDLEEDEADEPGSDGG